MFIINSWLDNCFIKLLQQTGHRVILTAHNPTPLEGCRKKDMQRLLRIYRSVDHIIVLTQQAGRELKDKFDMPTAKVSVIPHGDYISLFSRFSINESLVRVVSDKAGSRRIISFIGIIRPYKGLDYFIEAFALIKNRLPDSFFLIAGSVLIGHKKKLKEKLAQSCPPEDLWADIRFIPTEDLKTYLSLTDVLVQPYVNASQSGNIVMAYTEGIPVVTTGVGGLAEMAEDGKTGYIIPTRNPQALADAVTKCFEGENYEFMSQHTRRLAREKYQWHNIAFNTVQIYQNTIKAN